MGHYLSESYSDEYWAKQERKARERRARLMKGVQEEIEKRGIAEVIADIIDGRMRHSWDRE